MTIKKSSKRGFTLVELMIVVAIVGVLAALAVYGVQKYTVNAKTAEARNSLGQLAKDASSAYWREKMAGTALAPDGTAANALCTLAAAKVPAAKTSIEGRKYQSTVAEWNAGSPTAGWNCLKFSMQEPQHYMYGYTSTAATFTATAEGDLDGDTSTSIFTLPGSVVFGVVNIGPNIGETRPEE